MSPLAPLRNHGLIMKRCSYFFPHVLELLQLVCKSKATVAEALIGNRGIPISIEEITDPLPDEVVDMTDSQLNLIGNEIGDEWRQAFQDLRMIFCFIFR